MELPRFPTLEGEQTLDYCFGCGELNPIGLHLRPSYDGEKVTARFTPGLNHQGLRNVTHGGILFSVLDEITAYVLDCYGYRLAVTAKSTVRFKQVSRTSEPLIASAWPTRVTSRLIEVHGVLELEMGDVVAEIDSAFIPGNRFIRAFLWDMDGVLVDSAALHYQAWQAAFATRGVAYSEGQFRSLFGTRDSRIMREVLGSLPNDERQKIKEEKERRYRELMRGQLRAFPGVQPLLKAMKAAGFPVALTTSAPPENVQTVLSQLGWEQYFDAVICGEHVAEVEPGPEIYLQAAERLGVDPRNCFVFEDSPCGVQAAKHSGMKCVAVSNSHPAESLQAADRVVTSLEEIDLVQLLRWM